MKLNNTITWEELTTLLDYNSETGIFTWKENRRGTAIKGSIAGAINGAGYRQISIRGKVYLAHRLAWFYAFKEWPEYQIDHIDRNRSNNSLDNLRDVPQSINIHNADTSSKLNMSGYKNVRKRGEHKFQATVEVYGKYISLGVFTTAEEASYAAANYKEKYIHEHTGIS